jgi:hypothetical protein
VAVQRVCGVGWGRVDARSTRGRKKLVEQSNGQGKVRSTDVGLVSGGPLGRSFPDSRLKGGQVQ